ncbi:restriction endonuclease [Rhizobium sp. SG741]|uniref:restriction endonuclease n=1 Tax=Rhizobium sp. SG741 TaxID=2587114 RepID=UPI001FEE3358|nr:restriction endonuclease [Rhizobium sp. SG741]
MKLLDDLFGMSGGWVLDFSNRTFDEFFRHELGIDIYDDAYGVNGTSKGKHLRAFLEIGQQEAVIKALTALWEYREAGLISRGEKDTVHGGRERLNAIMLRLGGKSLPPDPMTASPEPAQPQRTGPTERTLQALEDEFTRLHGMEDARQARGYAFERFLKTWFDAWGLDARASFKLEGEQIDGSFEHRGSVYLIEAKWTNTRTDAAALRSFQEKVGDGFEGTRGLFVSYSGFTTEGLQAFKSKRVILMEGMDVYYALRRRISLDEVIAAKFRRGTEERRPLILVSELFPQA